MKWLHFLGTRTRVVHSVHVPAYFVSGAIPEKLDGRLQIFSLTAAKDVGNQTQLCGSRLKPWHGHLCDAEAQCLIREECPIDLSRQIKTAGTNKQLWPSPSGDLNPQSIRKASISNVQTPETLDKMTPGRKEPSRKRRKVQSLHLHKVLQELIKLYCDTYRNHALHSCSRTGTTSAWGRCLLHHLFGAVKFTRPDVVCVCSGLISGLARLSRRLSRGIIGVVQGLPGFGR